MPETTLCEIVLVDDEVLIRQGIKHYLDWEREGFRIVGEASNGKEALAVIEKTRPHIVMTDLVMPVMDGEELTRRIKSLYPGIEVIVLSSFGEFDFVRSTFQSGVADYILKPKLEENELLRILRATASRIPALSRKAEASPGKLGARLALEKHLNGYEEALDGIEADQAFPFPYFCLAGVELNGQEPEGAGAESMRGALEEALEALAPTAGFCLLEPKSGVFAALVNLESPDRSGVQDALSGVAALTEERFPRAAFALSRLYGKLASTADAYRNELQRSFQRRFYFPERRVIAEEELPPPGPSPGPFPLHRFSEQLQHHRFEEAFAELAAYVDRLAACHDADVLEFKSFLTAILFNITVLLVEGKHDVKELDRVKYAYFNEINAAFSASDAVECLHAFLQEAMLCIGGADHPQGGGSSMKRLLDYVETNYAEPLTLKEMAKHFHFNPSYLSRYFSLHNREGFTEYLNKIRIGKAAELLRQREVSISDISGKVGYSDPSYFARVFKKATGSSPSEYRRLHAKP